MTLASDTELRRAMWDAIAVGRSPYVIVRGMQHTDTTAAQGGSDSPTVDFEDAVVPPDSDGGDMKQSD